MLEPHFATIVKDYATAVAIVAGGIWAIWRWSHGEILRRRREMASPDGSLTITYIDLASGMVIVTLNAVWRNRGPLPIELCSEHSSVRVYELSESIKIGAVDIHDRSAAKLAIHIAPWWSTYVFEPNTESLMQEHVVLERERVYIFRWRICLPPGSLPGRYANEHLFVMRDVIWQAPVAGHAPDHKLGIPAGN